MSEKNEEKLSISQASERTGLPESTIRYYDQQFGGFLNIERGNNNQRLFTEKKLEDLEYIRYLIKREELSVEEVGRRLEREQKFASRKNDQPDPETTGGEQKQSVAPERLEKMLEKIEHRLDNLEAQQEEIRQLLDMNLQRYNKLVEDL